MELNLFNSLVNDDLSLSEFKNDMNIVIRKLLDKGYQGKINIERLVELFSNYSKWNAIYNDNPASLKEKLDFRCINQTVFNRSLGFARIVHVSGDLRLNLESPLGAYNSERGLYGFVDVVLGLKPCFIN